MSLNLHLDATRKVTVNKTRKQSKQTVSFGLYQTPIDVTNKAINSGNPRQVYIEWVKSISKDEVEPIFAEDDIWGSTPIGTQTVNRGLEHIADLAVWLKECDDEGYDIEWSGW